MSAYANGGQRPLFNTDAIADGASNLATNLDLKIEHSTGNSQLIDKLEGFVSATRQIDAALQQERMRSRRFQEELKGAHEHFERLLTERDFKCRELALQEGKIRAVLGQERERGTKLEKQVSTLKSEVDRVRAELKQYQGQWAVILQREREAKSVIEECNQQRKHIEDLESSLKKARAESEEYRVKNEQAERHTKTYQTELQSVLVRLHSAEAKFSSVQKEFQVLHQNRKNLEEEIARAEKTAQERLEWKLQKEVEKASSAAREQAVKQVRDEYEQKLIAEKLTQSKQLQSAEQEIMRLRGELAKIEKDRQVMNARTEDMKSALNAERSRALSLESAVQELVEKTIVSGQASEVIEYNEMSVGEIAESTKITKDGKAQQGEKSADKTPPPFKAKKR